MLKPRYRFRFFIGLFVFLQNSQIRWDLYTPPLVENPFQAADLLVLLALLAEKLYLGIKCHLSRLFDYKIFDQAVSLTFPGSGITFGQNKVIS